MAKFSIDSTDPAIPATQVEAKSLVGAISKVLGRFGGDGSATVNVDVSTDGQAELWGDGDEHSVLVESEEDTFFDLGGDPTTELWDAPTPGSGAQSALEMSAGEESRAIQAISDISSSLDEMAACEKALDALMTHIPAESGSILLAEAEHLRFVCVRGPKAEVLSGRTIPIDGGVAGAVLASGTPLHIRQARRHESHHTEFDQSINHLTKTLLALPIFVGGEPRGVLELLNPFGSDRFGDAHQTFAHAVTLALGERLTSA